VRVTRIRFLLILISVCISSLAQITLKAGIVSVAAQCATAGVLAASALLTVIDGNAYLAVLLAAGVLNVRLPLPGVGEALFGVAGERGQGRAGHRARLCAIGPAVVQSLGTSSGMVSVLVLAMYTLSSIVPELYPASEWLWAHRC
jgi:hypothetical protein